MIKPGIYLLILFLEICVFNIWYYFIYRKKVGIDRSLIWLLAMFIRYIHFLIVSYCFYPERRKKLKVFFEAEEDVEECWLGYEILIIAAGLLIPLITMWFVVGSKSILTALFWVTCGVGAIISFLFREDEDLTNTLRARYRYLVRFQQARLWVLSEENVENSIKNNFKKIGSYSEDENQMETRHVKVVILLWVLGALLVLLLYVRNLSGLITGKYSTTELKLNPLQLLPSERVLLITATAIFIWIFTNKKGCLEQWKVICKKITSMCGRRRSEKGNDLLNEIYIASELREFDNDIHSMCNELGIKRVTVKIVEKETMSVVAVEERWKKPEIRLERVFFEQILQYFEVSLCEDVIKMILGHELVHVKYRDFRGNAVIMGKMFVITFLVFLGLIRLYPFTVRNKMIFLIWMAVLLFNCFIILPIVTDSRYWVQVRELRADRIGAEVSRTSPEVLENFLQFQMRMTGNVKDVEKNLVYWYYENNIRMEEHPSLERRIYELKRGKDWGITEHIRYIWMIRWKTWIRRSWKI